MSTAKDAAKYLLGLYQITTSPLRLMPEFIIIGAQKCGTTSLYYYLVEHSNIASAWRKELRFFDNNFKKGLAWYHGQFPFSIRRSYAQIIHKQDLITGEASPDYFFHTHAPKRVRSILPQVKLIVLLRNPADRAYSHYRHQVARGRESLSFEKAITYEEERTRGEREKVEASETYYSYNYEHFSYISRGIYADYLQKWFNLFPREQFLILKSEDLYADPAAILKQTLRFLDVPEVEPKRLKEGYEKYNNSESKEHTKFTPPSKLDPEFRQRLVEFYKPHNARLYELLGRDFGWN